MTYRMWKTVIPFRRKRYVFSQDQFDRWAKRVRNNEDYNYMMGVARRFNLSTASLGG